MGDLSRVELREEILANLGGREDTDGDPVVGRVNRHIHLAQLRIARANPSGWRELFVADEDPITAASTYDLPADLRALYSLRIKKVNGHSPKLVEVPQRQFDQLFGDPSTVSGADEPSHYVRWSKLRLEWWPVPSEDFDLLRRYSIWPTDFTDDDEVSDFEEKDDMLIALASSTLLHSLGETEDARRWFGIYSNMLSDARVLDRTKPDMSIHSRGARDEEAVVDPVADPFVRRTV